jgi:hypothetical protein
MKMTLRCALAGLAITLFTGCAASPETGSANAETPAEARPVADANVQHEVKMAALPFRVDVTYSAGARAYLRESGAFLSLVADYYGLPSQPGMTGLDPDLGVWLDGEHTTLDSGKVSATFKGQFDAARVAREIAGDPRVRVVAYPIRGTKGRDALTCSEFDEALPIAVETGGFVHCTLPGGG